MIRYCGCTVLIAMYFNGGFCERGLDFFGPFVSIISDPSLGATVLAIFFGGGTGYFMFAVSSQLEEGSLMDRLLTSCIAA